MEKYFKQIGVGGLEISRREKELVNQVLDSNQLTYSQMTKKFESQFASLHDSEFGLFLNSGTSALQIALQALKISRGWQDGDEVLVPAVTFVATANIVIHNGMVPVFVDVDPETYNMDANLIIEKITPRTRAILPVHLLGLPSEMSKIMKIAHDYHLAVIEDSAECMFAEFDGKKVGSFGDVGCFSTYVAHFLVTGVGGLATTSNPDLAILMRSLMNHGRDSIYLSSTDDIGVSSDRLREIVEKRFRFVDFGHSFRATELEAALGVGQLERYKEIVGRRLSIAEYFNKELSGLDEFLQTPSCPEDRTHSYMLYGLVLKKESKTELVGYLENLNVETRDMLPLINQPVYIRRFGNLEEKYPVAKWINQNGFYVGCHSYMSDSEVEFTAAAIKSYFG
jgi:CDP-6-deoxy-D-xylo-4-hexulose-3-dehydrase